MDVIKINKPTKLYKIYLKVYKNDLVALLLGFVVMYIILKAYIILYAIAGYGIFLLFTGGYGGLVSYPFRFNINKEQKNIVIHYFKVPFIKKYRSFISSEIKVEYALPKNFAHNKDDEPWLLISHKGELVFYINQHNVVGWSQEEILSIYNKLSVAIQQ